MVFQGIKTIFVVKYDIIFFFFYTYFPLYFYTNTTQESNRLLTVYYLFNLPSLSVKTFIFNVLDRDLTLDAF